MKFKAPAVEELKNESDVEQKLIYPLLTAELPYGLGFAGASVLTKHNIRALSINKGRSTKSYFPDYLITQQDYPLIVVEAKTPGEDLVEAYREARLYSQEINALFPAGINPCVKVIATDGMIFLAGNSDELEPCIELKLEDLIPASELFAKFVEGFSVKAVSHLCEKYDALLKPSYLKKPRRIIGGKALQNEEVGHNSFGANIAAELGHIFNPSSIEDRIFIVRNGYIPSKRRERYIDPIDKIIRAAKPPSEADAKLIEDTANPSELVKVIARGKVLEHKVILIVGGVGAGKTTFIDYLREVALPRDVAESSLWIRINMNESPISGDEIYNWLRAEIVSGCKRELPDIDFDDLDVVQKVYSVELARFNKVQGRLLKGTPEYNLRLVEELDKLEADRHSTAVAFTRFCGTERGKLPIIVLDNCDKRTLNEQLLMFQAAQWLQREFKALVILPLREETYDNHRERPPLDTALKDMVFRIEPPMFQQVLVKRVQLALREIGAGQSGSLRYDLPNGYTVEYSKTDTSLYLMSILKSIFDHDKYVRRIIVGLSARNIRRAMEIFLEFCTSGHIKEDQIFKIRRSEGKYTLPLYQVSRVLLRMNRRFYDGDASYIKNIFSTTQFDARTNYFCRYLILRWLKSRFHQFGPSPVKGYFKVRDVKDAIMVYGFEDSIVTRDIEHLLAGHCLLSEDFRIDQITDDDLIRIAPAGFVHLDLLSNITYLAALAEDTLFSDESLTRAIAGRISDLERHYDVNTTYENARDLVGYLERERERQAQLSGTFLSQSEFLELSDLSDMKNALESHILKNTPKDWLAAETEYPVGSEHSGVIKNVDLRYGVFVLIGKLTGLVHVSKFSDFRRESERFRSGARIAVVIENVDVVRKKIALALPPET